MIVSAWERRANYLILIAFSLLMVVPLLSVVLLALQPQGASISAISPSQMNFDNFIRVWTVYGFPRYLANSALVAIVVVLAGTFLSILTGYAFGTMHFRGERALFILFLAGLMMPYEAAVIPLYYDFRGAGLDDTYTALMLPQIGLALSFGTFWMRAYFKSSPRYLVEAASIDGASSWSILWRVLLPGARPALVTLAVLLFMWTWNEFLLALVMISSPDLRTAPLGLASFVGEHTTDLTGLAAAASLTALPIVILYLIFQRHFIRGMLSGGVRE